MNYINNPVILELIAQDLNTIELFQLRKVCSFFFHELKETQIKKNNNLQQKLKNELSTLFSFPLPLYQDLTQDNFFLTIEKMRKDGIEHILTVNTDYYPKTVHNFFDELIYWKKDEDPLIKKYWECYRIVLEKSNIYFPKTSRISAALIYMYKSEILKNAYQKNIKEKYLFIKQCHCLLLRNRYKIVNQNYGN